MSPGNVVIDYDGNVKIVDFGIAQVMVSGSEVTETVKGKLSYMSPEQAMGHRTDGRADQYAVGVIAYEALSGTRPNDGGNDSETLSCILGGRHVPLAQRVTSLPEKLGAVVERMLARRPEQRFASMDAVLDALAELTPSLTTYRDLVPLVISARQPHTIVQENGRLVSRPVEADPVFMSMSPGLPAPPLAPAPSPLPRIDRRESLPNTSLAPPKPLVQTLAATVDETRQRRLPPAMPIKSNRVHSLAHTAVMEPGSFDPRPSPRAAAPVAPQAQPPRERVWVSRLFWQAFSVTGALVLGFVLWSAFFPDTLSFLSGAPGQSVVRPRAPEESSASGQQAVTVSASAPSAAPSDSSKPRALARVRVTPQGRVWVDGELRGEATPWLELALTPGEHVVAVGRNVPSETRTVVVGGGETALAFDLAGK
jgi:serine/threonine protein kinase